MKIYESIREIMKANREKGHHYFSPDTMRFFKSKVYEDIFHGSVFITSEQRDSEPRKYSVRCAMPDGSINSLSKFQAFDTKEQAVRWAKKLPTKIQQAIDSAEREFNTGKAVGIGFLANALMEPKNTKGKFSMSSFAGACTWLLINWNDTELSYLGDIAKQFEETLQAGFNNVPTNKDATL